jgi:Putative DNA-binding domain
MTMRTELTRFQDSFAQALIASDPAVTTDLEPEIAALVRQPGFAIYRNTVMKGCIDALQANYPSIARLVGAEWFRAAAAIYARAHLPAQATPGK